MLYKILKMQTVLLLVFFACAYSAKVDFTANTQSHKKVVTCYFASWAIYRQDKGHFTVDNIDPTLCTHLIYTFAGLDNITYTIRSLDPYLDTTDGGGRGQYAKFVSLKDKNPNLKVLLAIGGWNEGSQKYSDMASSSDRRKTFTQSAIAFLKKYGFDGLDLDWEYPGARSNRTRGDRDNFSLLVKDLRKEFNKNGLMLTAAVGAAIPIINTSYNVREISRYLDYIHVVGYDYHGSWDNKTGHNAPLHLPKDVYYPPQYRPSVEEIIQHYIKLCAPRSKLVLGLPFFGRTFILLDKDAPALYAPAKPLGFPGPYTGENGFMGFHEICEELSGNSTWSEQWDESTKTPYTYKENKFLTFDNARSIAIKTRYAYNENLAGVMVWSIDLDDFNAVCSEVQYPLLRSINSELKIVADEGEKGKIMPPNDICSSASCVEFSTELLYMLASIILLSNIFTANH